MLWSSSGRFHPVSALLLAGLLWGTADVAGKAALRDIPPITLATLRFIVALVVLWLLAHRHPSPQSVPRGQAALLGLFGVALAFLLQNAGLAGTAAANASMLQGAAPIMVVIGAAVCLRESPGYARWGGSGLALLGVGAITLTGVDGFTEPGAGDLCILASAASFAAFVLLGRKAFIDYGTIPVLAAAVRWGLIIMIPLALVEVLTTGVGPVELRTVPLVLYLGAGCSALTYLLWGYALRHLEASQAAVFDNVIPIVGVAAAALFLGERVTGWQAIGGMLVLGGAWITCRSSGPSVGNALTYE